MPLTDLESATPALFAACDQLLGDTMTIVPPSMGPITLKAQVIHKDTRRDFGISAATVQDALIDIDMALLPGKPGIGWRVTLPRIPAAIFEPRNVERDESGLRWEFGLKTVQIG